MTHSRLLLLLLAFMALVPVSLAQAEDRLCPDAESLAKQTPNDMAGIQADIDRMKLCVERAQLLRQLDDLAKQRQKILAEVTAPAVASNFMGNVPIPALPVSALPALQNVPTAQKPSRQNGSAQWRVVKIWGQENDSTGLRAQLSNGTGTLLNVTKGDALPDGQVVETLNGRGVTLSQNGKINDLEWEDAEEVMIPKDAPPATIAPTPVTPPAAIPTTPTEQPAAPAVAPIPAITTQPKLN